MPTKTNISGYQKRSLEFYLFFRDKKLTMASMWIFNAKLYIWILLIFSVVTLFYYFIAGVEGASLIVAMFIGAFLRDIGTFRKSVSNWPILNEIIDWEKARLLLEKTNATKN